jgi:tRNA threonylcarbamoyladenosine biosynthesis protein TsaB
VPLVGGTFSAQLMPQIAALLDGQGLDKYSIGVIAVVSGPGSFTGLRVGLAAVKALAEVLNKPIAAVSLLELCVFSSGAVGRVTAALDAGRGDFHIGIYEVPGRPDFVARENIVSAAEFLAEARDSTVVTSDSALAEKASAGGLKVCVIASMTAAAVARLGWRKIKHGETVTPDQLEANYIRRTDAEILQKTGS